jgi:hypothetical protein
MRDFPPNPTSAPEESPGKGANPPGAKSKPASTSPAEEELTVASHEALFVEVPSMRCDACGEPTAETDGAEGYCIPGRGVYLWARGDETRLESVPLCASCASAIGMTALARWEIEEEEG